MDFPWFVKKGGDADDDSSEETPVNPAWCTDPLAKNHVEVSVYRDVPIRRIMPYRVKRVISPFEFYAEYGLNTICKSYFDWHPVMQHYYNDPMIAEKMKVRNGQVLRGKCYVCYGPNNKWHRVRAHSIVPGGGGALVYYLDLGDKQVVPLKDFLELDPSFCTWPAQTFRCYLYDVLPKGNDYLKWSPDACIWFKQFAEGREFNGIVLARSDDKVDEDVPDVCVTLGLVLYPLGVDDGDDKCCTVNATVVKKGFARSIGILSACDHQFHLDNCTPYFDMSAFEELYGKLPPPTPPPAPTKAVPSNSGFSKEFLHMVTTRAIDFMKPEPSWIPSEFETIDPEAAKILTQCKSPKLPDNFRERLCQVSMSFLKGPDHIMLHLQSQLENMHTMQKCLKAVLDADAGEGVTLSELIPGQLVACIVYDKTHAKDTAFYCRGIVKTVSTKSGLAKILMVDYGNEMAVCPENIQFLPEHFQSIPAFIMRVHLDAKLLLPNGQTGWSSDACLAFRKYVFAWEEDDPSYYMFRPPQSEGIELSDYTQDVVYDFQLKKWKAGPAKKIRTHEVINDLKMHPMVRPYFTSVGAEIFFEVFIEDTPFWFFEPVYDQLVLNDFCDAIAYMLSKSQIHVSIRSGIVVNWDSDTPFDAEVKGGFIPEIRRGLARGRRRRITFAENTPAPGKSQRSNRSSSISDGIIFDISRLRSDGID